jgi:hypothetical protein
VKPKKQWILRMEGQPARTAAEHTKGEARARFKPMVGVRRRGRLPVGARVEKAG